MQMHRLIYRGPIKTMINKFGTKKFFERNYWRIMHILSSSVQASVGGCSYTVDTEEWKEQAQFSTQGGETPVIEKFLSDIRQNDVVWDVGANVGLYSIPASTIAEEVVAFEPVPYNAARLRNHASDIDVREVAISNMSGEISIPEQDDISLGWSTKKDSNSHITRDIVPPTKIDAPWPTVVKMDIEGGEWNALHGMQDWLSEGIVRLIYVEVHPRHLPADADISAYLEKFGYTCEKIHQRGENYFIVGRIDR